METYGGADLKGSLRLLQAAAFLSNFDRFTVAPMLLTIAADLRVSLAEVAAVASEGAEAKRAKFQHAYAEGP